MDNHRRYSLACSWAIALILVVVGATTAGADSANALSSDQLKKLDQGPSTIDVSKYPDKVQAEYKVFISKCSQCHKPSRPINSDFALPDEWGRYIKRMMFKPGSGIGRSDAKAIYDFLVYDSAVRKKSLLDGKMQKLPADQRQKEQKKLDKVLSKYDTH